MTPRHPLRKGRTFVVKVAGFTATPTVPGDTDASTAFFITPDGSATAPQPYYAHLVYPSNDHPRDKATFRFDINVPEGTKAVANGVETGRRTRHGRTKWTYVMRQPMATELTQIAVGNWDFSTPQRHHGVILRDVTAPSVTAVLQPALAIEPGQLDYMEARVGRYPFDIFGSLIVIADLGFALETQTHLPARHDLVRARPRPSGTRRCSTSCRTCGSGTASRPYEWSDLWLNEGHASWYEFVYADEKGFLTEDTTNYPDEQGYATLEELMRAVYGYGDQWRHDYGPVAKPSSGGDDLFSFNVYHGGALVLYALRQKIGNAAFDRVERAWVARYRDKVAGTDDFIALAAKVSHRDVTGFLRKWLYGETTPRMPGHPDWTVRPGRRAAGSRAGAQTRERSGTSTTLKPSGPRT